jgi:hypothetical protein
MKLRQPNKDTIYSVTFKTKSVAAVWSYVASVIDGNTSYKRETIDVGNHSVCDTQRPNEDTLVLLRHSIIQYRKPKRWDTIQIHHGPTRRA